MSFSSNEAGDEHQAREREAASSQKRENYWGGFELQAALKSSKTQQPKKGIAEIEDYYL